MKINFIIYLRSAKKGLVFFLFLFFLNFPVSLTSQVTVSLQLPPPGSFTPEDFIRFISFNNQTGLTRQVYLSGTVEEQTAGLIFSGTTSVFELLPGVSNPPYNSYEPLTLDYLSPVYESYVLQANTLPPGDYIICVLIRDAITNDQLGNTCVPHSVFKPTAPILVYPLNESEISEPMPVFTWLPPSPLPAIEIFYMISIAELHEGQTPYEAIRSNPPFYSEPKFSGTALNYGIHLPPMVSGQRYVWQVQARTADGLPVGENHGFSEISYFTYQETVKRSITLIQPIATCVGNVSTDLMSHVTDMKWMATGQFTGFQVIVYENPCGRYPKTPTKPSKPSTPSTPSKPSTPTNPTKPKTSPTTPTDSLKVTPADSLINKPGGVVTTPWEPDTSGKGVTVTPADTFGPGIKDWPEGDDDHDYRPPLPPGWAWGDEGPYWTGEHPPPPPDLPPGWEWGPLRPHWTGEGSPPPDRTILYVSQTIESIPVTPPDILNLQQEVLYQEMIPLHQFLEPGQAFIYQIYGTYQNTEGSMQGFLSEPQCMRYSATATGTDTAAPVSCQVCMTRIEPRIGPVMNGGLNPPKDTLQIYRDEFIVFRAEGADYDEIWWFCTPGPDCPETPSTDMRVTSSRVKFTWEIIDGDGDFTEIGCSGTKRATEGERVIFMPPYVKPDTTVMTKIKLSIIDDNTSQPEDKTVERIIKIKTERTRKEPNQYKVTIDSDAYKLPQASQVTGLASGTCRTQGPVWTKDTNLTKPEIKLPGSVADADKLVYKELIRLYAEDIRDPDNIRVWCLSAVCDTMSINRDFEDDVEFTWSITKGGGSFIKGNKGRYVIFEAPEKEGVVEIEVRVKNPSYLKIKDKDPEPGKITLKVYQPGVKIEQTPLAWLPEAGNILQKKSFLVYKDNNEWKDGLNHQCRIHFVELLDVSTEPGVCLNWPPKNHGSTHFVDFCQDLSIRDSSGWESFDTTRCKRWNHTDSLWYKKANSLKPEKEFTVKINSYDYGGYGFARSLANGSQSIKTPYESVPWEVKDKKHPKRPDDTKPAAKDNRVTIPRDADENKVPDNGWQTALQKSLSSFITGYTGALVEIKEEDPKDAANDLDSLPLSNFGGDGISAYEEYRGFMVKGTHNRFSMSTKDLLMWDRNNLGIGDFNKTGILNWFINQNEMDTGRVINLNRKTHNPGFDQKGIKLFVNESAAMSTSFGWAVRSVSRDGLVTCDSVLINSALITSKGKDASSTIAHELSHAVGVRHHGEGIIEGYLLLGKDINIDGSWFSSTVDSAWFYSACARGVTSGDILCWMRYDDYIRYCPVSPVLKNLNCPSGDRRVNMENLRIRRVNDTHVGKDITNLTTGTGINNSNECGSDAATGRGECKSQIRVSCKRP